jgi:hypothetical protein
MEECPAASACASIFAYCPAMFGTSIQKFACKCKKIDEIKKQHLILQQTEHIMLYGSFVISSATALSFPRKPFLNAAHAFCSAARGRTEKYGRHK